MQPRSVLPLSLLLLGFVYSGCGTGSSNSTPVIDAMEAAFETNMDGVETFTIYASGIEAHHRRNTTDSLNFFDLGVTLEDSSQSIPESARLIPLLAPDVPKLVRGLRTGARLVGKEMLNGQQVDVLEADNPTALVVGPDVRAGDIISARVYVDAVNHFVRGVTMEMPPPDTSLTDIIIQTVRYEQFREVEGITLPFKITSKTEGLRQLISEEMRVVENGNLAIARSQAQQLPPGEKEVQLAQIAARERFLNEGIQEDVLTVDSVHVNRPLPAEAFME